jgi:hypothetical protein
MPKTTKFVDSRVSKAVRSLKEDDPSFVTMPASQDGMRKTMSSLNTNAIVGMPIIRKMLGVLQEQCQNTRNMLIA